MLISSVLGLLIISACSMAAQWFRLRQAEGGQALSPVSVARHSHERPTR
jgi:hypothetical protein